MSEEGYSSRGSSPKMSYRQIMQQQKTMKKSFAVAEKLAPKIRAHEEKESQEADQKIEEILGLIS